MAEVKREISGFFLSSDKFASHVAALAHPECAVTHLRLFHNEPQHTAAVLHALSTNTSVHTLDIFELDAAAAATLAALLSATPRLTSLSIHHAHNRDAIAHLARGLSANRSLSHLHLSQLDAAGVKTVASALASWAAASSGDPPNAPPTPSLAAPDGAASAEATAARLQHLRLDKCVVSAEAASELAAALSGQAAVLSRLEVVESDLGDLAAEALLASPGWRAVVAASALGSLDLSSCHIGARGAACLGSSLADTRSLRTLNLANNKLIGCSGAAALAAGLGSNRSLLRLDLSGCGVGRAGVQALADALCPPAAETQRDGATAAVDAAAPSTEPAAADGGIAAADRPPLQHLTLNGNDAGAAGLAALLRALSGPSPCHLQILQLDQNHIRGTELATALPPASPPPRVTAPLEQLSLAGNSLYDAGVALLAACLAEAPRLEQLDLRENGISDAGVAALLPLVTGPGGAAAVAAAAPPPQRRSSSGGGGGAAGGLQGLLLDGNRLHNSGAQALLEAVTAAPGLWRFSAEGNKLTDPALRLSLTQLSQLRAARHSQLVVLGRHYSSSSEDGGEGDSRRGSGGGGGADRRSGSGGAAAGRGRSSGGGGSTATGGGGPAPMDVERRGGGDGGGSVAAEHPAAQPSPGYQHHHHHHKHRLEEQDEEVDEERQGAAAAGGGGGYGRQQPRNVAARSSEGAAEREAGRCGNGGAAGADVVAAYVEGACGGGGGGGCGIGTSAVPSGGSGPMTGSEMCWRSASALPPAGPNAPSRPASNGGSSVDGLSFAATSVAMDIQMLDTPTAASAATTTAMSGAAGGAPAPAGLLCGSPPQAMCYVTAVMGVGGAGSVGVSKRVNGGGDGVHQMHFATAPGTAAEAAAGGTGGGGGGQCVAGAFTPQQILPACRRPRYKPLTPEQQRLFEDF